LKQVEIPEENQQQPDHISVYPYGWS